MERPYDIRETAQALHLLAEFAHVGPGEAREIARTLTQFADEADAADRPRGNVWLVTDGSPIEIGGAK